MSYFEECLSLGQWLSESTKRALFQFLILTFSERYQNDARVLLRERWLNRSVANGEIIYEINGDLLSYKAKDVTEVEFTRSLREVKLGRNENQAIQFMVNYFAQVEVDVIANYPIPGDYVQEHRSYSFNAYPFYDLNYYSNGKGKLIGYLKKRKVDDSENLNKLMAS